MSKKPDDSKAAQWRSHIQAWQQSGLSQARYCQQHELVLCRFVYWRRKLRDRPQPSSGFVQVTPRATSESLSVRLPSGLEIRGVDAGNLAVVTELLARLS